MKTTFAELNKNDFFTIECDCGVISGKAELMKLNGVFAKCISSCNGTYIKCVEYPMQPDQIVTKTNK